MKREWQLAGQQSEPESSRREEEVDTSDVSDTSDTIATSFSGATILKKPKRAGSILVTRKGRDAESTESETQ